MASWELDCSITLELQQAERMVAQDFSSPQVQKVCYVSVSGCGRRRRFVEAAGGSGTEADILRIYTPLVVYEAKTVLLEGPRVIASGHAERLFASLVGRYVVTGCDLLTADGLRYRVKGVELKTGYRGVALVCSTARVKLNQKLVDATFPEEALVGLEGQAHELTVLMQTMAQSPGQWIGVFVHDSGDCGALTVVKKCTKDARGVFLRWSPSAAYGQELGIFTGQLVVLCVPDLDDIFPPSDAVLSGLTVRTLRRFIESLLNVSDGERPAVVLVGVSTTGMCEVASSLFSVSISFALPDVDARAALLASVRGGDKRDHITEAHALVGLSRAAVLDVARGSYCPRAPLSKTLRWSDIGGLDEVKNRLRQALIFPQLEPEVFSRFRVTPPRGILLYGPPGCAKTSLVKALCSEGIFSFLYLDSAGLISAYVGESERMLRETFQKASRQAPCIVFFDEVDVIGGRRAMNSRDGDQTRLLSTLLTEMDGFSSVSGVCFVGATNAPHLLDDALLRPGRFDYLVYVPLPSLGDRRKILSLTLANTAADVDRLAHATEGFSGADLSALTSGVLLEILDGADEGCATDRLNDREALTQLLLERGKVFPRVVYDVGALERFSRDHALSTRAA